MPQSLRYGLGAALALLYAIGSAVLMSTRPESAWAMLVVLGPMAGALLVGLWRAAARWLALLATLVAALVCIGLGWATPPAWSPKLLYLGQHAGVHLVLGSWFGASLRRGQVPLVTRFAGSMHHLTPAMQRYTRSVTVAWTVYFGVIVLLSLALFAWARFEIWTIFANLVTPLSLVSMFAIEYLVRYHLHPDFERVGPVAAWRAFRDHRPPPPGP
jgi:uncharacterized membrane protein